MSSPDIDLLQWVSSLSLSLLIALAHRLPLSRRCSRNELTPEYSILWTRSGSGLSHRWHLHPAVWVSVDVLGSFRSLRRRNAKPSDEPPPLSMFYLSLSKSLSLSTGVFVSSLSLSLSLSLRKRCTIHLDRNVLALFPVRLPPSGSRGWIPLRSRSR